MCMILNEWDLIHWLIVSMPALYFVKKNKRTAANGGQKIGKYQPLALQNPQAIDK